jgi:hypothetical protein
LGRKLKEWAPVIVLLVGLFTTWLGDHVSIAELKMQLRDNEARQEMMEQTLGRIETRLMVVR